MRRLADRLENRRTRLDLHLIFGLADLRYLLDPPENPYVRHVHS